MAINDTPDKGKPLLEIMCIERPNIEWVQKATILIFNYSFISKPYNVNPVVKV